MALTDLQVLAGGKHELTFVDADGNETKRIASQLTFNDLAEFEREVGPLSVFEQPARQFTAIRYALWRALRHADPAITLEEVGDLFGGGDIAVLTEMAVSLIFGAAPNLKAPDAKADTGAKPTGARRSRTS